MREWTRNHGLLLANVLLFVVFFGGMTVTGAASYSEDQLAHGRLQGPLAPQDPRPKTQDPGPPNGTQGT